LGKISTKGLKVYEAGFDFFKFLTLCSENPIDPKTGKKAYKGNCFSPDDRAADGSICGFRAAILRPGGEFKDYL
jgi:hypothetical protein